jgi:hypothetical protein
LPAAHPPNMTQHSPATAIARVTRTALALQS